MAKPMNQEDQRDFLRQARERFERAWAAERENRIEALDDLKFRAGEQWPENVKSERQAASRPTLTINRMPQFIRQVTGDIRQNKPAIKVRPVDGNSDPALARTISGIIRHIEQASDAAVAYNTAADGAATCGIGHFRIVTEYADDDAFEQDIRIRRIRNPFAVYWDPDAEALTREDARWCFVTERLPLEDFKARWPEASPVWFETNEARDELDRWWDGETVRIAEYWVKEPVTKKLALLESGETVSLDGLGKKAVAALPVVRTREVETHKVVHYLLNGAEILEGPHDWAGRYIPVVPVCGEEVHIGDRVVRHGIIRYAKDPQRLYNYWRTTAAESVALAPKAPWLLTPRQLEGQKAKWESANKGNPPYLLYNPDPSAPPPQRTVPAHPPVAMFQEAQIAVDDLKAVTGIHDASLGAQGNETSGRAILMRQRVGDVGTFVYIDNLARAIRHAGRILVDLIPRIYDTERTVRILGEDDNETFAVINQVALGPDGPVVLNDLSAGKYDVEVVTGPSFSTKRIEAAESMMAFVQAVPSAAALISDLIARNMDWPGAEAIAERLKRALPPGVATDGPVGAETPPPDPAALLAAAQAQAGLAKTQAEIEGKQLDNAKKQLDLSEGADGMEALVERKVMESLAAMLNDDGTPVAPKPAAIPPEVIAPDVIPVPPLESGAPVPPDAEPDKSTT